MTQSENMLIESMERTVKIMGQDEKALALENIGISLFDRGATAIALAYCIEELKKGTLKSEDLIGPIDPEQ